MNDNVPTYCGQPANQGKLIPRPLHEGEGFAVLKCGGTEVVLSYTLLHHLRFEHDSEDTLFHQVLAAEKGLLAITCEASLGKTP